MSRQSSRWWVPATNTALCRKQEPCMGATERTYVVSKRWPASLVPQPAEKQSEGGEQGQGCRTGLWSYSRVPRSSPHITATHDGKSLALGLVPGHGTLKTRFHTMKETLKAEEKLCRGVAHFSKPPNTLGKRIPGYIMDLKLLYRQKLHELA